MSEPYDPTCFTSSDAKVYHRVGNIKYMEQDFNKWQWMTACGKPITHPWGIRSIDRKRADLLGRPCGKCFRGEK